MACSLVNDTCGTGGWSGPLPGDPDTNALLTAVPVFGGIDVSWTAALVNPHAVAHTLLYRSLSPDFETAVRIAVVGGTFFYDKLEDLNRYYYWIQVVSINGTYGDIIGPASAVARLSIEDTIEALTNRIDRGVLAESLKQDIDKITVLGADLMQEINDRIAANELLGAALQTAQNGVDQAFSIIEEEIQQRTTAYNVLVQAINTMAAQINDTQAAIQNESLLRIEGDETLAQQTSLLYAAKSELQAAVNQVSQAIIDGDDALANQISTVQTALNDSVASVQTSMQTQIDTVNGKVTQIGALYTAKVSVNGLIGGFGVYNDGTEVQAGFDVDTFWVGRTNANKRKPFIIQDDEVFIDNAVIRQLTADKIDTRNLTIKDENGVILFGAGNDLDWSRIGGTEKPENGATVGASLAASFSSWNIGSQTLITVSDGKVGNQVLRLGTAVSYPAAPIYTPIDPTKKYRVRFWARPSADCNGLLYFSLRQAVNETGTWGPINGGWDPYKPFGQSLAAHNGTYGTGAWGEYSYIWSAADWQSGVKFFRPEFLNNYNGTAGYWDVQGLVIEEATDVEAAKDAANAAQTAANTANAALADIAADNKLTPVEKQSAANEWGIINRERASIQSQADALGILQERWDYDYVYAVLNDYITPLLQDISSTSVIDGATFRDKWSYFYEYRQRLLNKMAAVAATKADWSNVQSRPGDEDILNAGSNLILNPDLRNSPAGNGTTAKGWSFNANSGAFYYRGVLQDSANGPPFDSSAPMFYTNTTGADGQVSWITDEYIPVGTDRNYTVSAWLRRYSGNPDAYLGVICYDAAYASLGYLYPAGLAHLNGTTLSASWERRYGVFGPGYTAFPAGTKFVRVVWWGTYLSIGATLATRFCFNEGVVPSRSVVPLDSSLINKINPITTSNVTTYIANAAIGNAQIDRATVNKLVVGTADIASAAITNAKIGNAAIDTLQVAGDAISAPQSQSVAASSSETSTTSRTSTFTLGTFTTSPNGRGQVLILLSPNTHVTDSATAACAAYGVGNTSYTAKISIQRNGIDLVSVTNSVSATTTIAETLHTKALLDAPGANVSCTYRIYMQTTSDGSRAHRHEIPNITVTFFEFKR